MGTISIHKRLKTENRLKRVFGPVRSRRLGASLGIDCVPFKTCNYDCIYCELGRTDRKSNQMGYGVAVPELFEEVESALASSIVRPDYLTIAGAGEPTLYGGLEELIAGLKERSDIPVALLTNGSLFSRSDVRQAAARADLVIPSLDAGNERTFTAVNRPHPDISFEDMAEGLCRFRGEFSGIFWLEIFLLDGINTDAANLCAIKKYVDRIAPERIHLNTIDRIPAESYAKKVAPALLREIAEYFGSRACII